MSQTSSIYPKLAYRVQEEIVDTKSLLDETNFYHQRQGAPSVLTNQLTYLIGDYTNNYPLSLMTMGGVGYGAPAGAQEVDDVQFTYPVMGRRNKSVEVASTEYVNGDKPGFGNGKFYITFKDNWVKRFYNIQSERGTMAYVHKDGEPVSGGFRYECQLTSAGPTDFCPLNQLDPNVRWVEMFTSVAESESRSTESKMVMPGSFKNQMGFSRAGISWAGNSANKIMKITMETKAGKSNVWMDYAMWQFEERWLEECENMNWYSRYNRLLDGSIPLKDLLTSKDIPTGSGVLEQILNKSTYSRLTYKKIANTIGDALFGRTKKMNITLWTGTGGRREFHRAIMGEVGSQFSPTFAGLGNVTDKFISGSNYGLMLGGFFDGFYHIDGHVIKIKENPVYDIGRVAQVSPLHPETGLPLESYRMTFIDDGDQDGKPNIKHVVQKGNAYKHGILKGLTETPRSLNIMLGRNAGESVNLGTVQDKSEYTRMKSGGIQIMNGNFCFDLQCTAGLS